MRNIGSGTGIVAFALASLIAIPDASAVDGVVGPGNCNESGFASVLATVDGSGGGTITFDCGTATITFTSYKTIANAVTIDGGDHITFDGGNSSALFQVFASANATLKHLTLQHGFYTGVHAVEVAGELTMDHVRMQNNSSDEGALQNYGITRVTASTFTGNVAISQVFGRGAAIDNESGELHVADSTFNGNSAPYGGAIYSSGPLTVTNSTFSANTGTTGGGAIYQTDAGIALLDFVTVVGNTAPFGAALYNDGGGSSSMFVGRSLLSGNAGGNCAGVISSNGYNLSDDTFCGSAFVAAGDVNNVTLTMQALGNNGGPTATQPPQAGNPAIDHVPLAQCDQSYDQRGAPRPFGAACDSGAFEVGATVDLIFEDGFDGT